MQKCLATGIVLLALSAGDSRASGGISCLADDKNAYLVIDAGVTRGMGSPLFSVTAQAEARLEDVADDLRVTPFEQKHVAQYWLDDKELKMVLYREREAGEHGSVEIEVRTRYADESLYKGRYTLTVFDTVGDSTGEGKTIKAEGQMECFVE